MRDTECDDQALLDRLNRHPQIRQRIVALLQVAEATTAELARADDAEERVAQEVRRMGQQTLQAWAERQVEQTEQDIRHTGRAHREGKKNSAGTPRLATSAS